MSRMKGLKIAARHVSIFIIYVVLLATQNTKKAYHGQGTVSSIKESGILNDKGMQMQAHCMPCCILR